MSKLKWPNKLVRTNIKLLIFLTCLNYCIFIVWPTKCKDILQHRSSLVRLGTIMHAYSCLCLSLEWDWLPFNAAWRTESADDGSAKIVPTERENCKYEHRQFNRPDNRNSDMQKAACIWNHPGLYILMIISYQKEPTFSILMRCAWRISNKQCVHDCNNLTKDINTLRSNMIINVAFVCFS